MRVRCTWCDAAVPLMARSCPECSAANPARRTVLGAVATIAVLAPAIAIAIYVATRWEQPLLTADRPADLPLPSQPVTGSDADFNWLSAAMKACDDKALHEPNVLHFIVVPLSTDAKNIGQWRLSALNRVGNALVVPGDGMLNGLRRKELSIAPEEYVFSIRDEKTQTVRKWEPSKGVKWLSVADADGVTSLRIQYKPRDQGRDDNWGNVLEHRPGSCYWVNAVFEE